MPLGFLRAFRDPAITWGYLSEPEPHLNGRVLPCRAAACSAAPRRSTACSSCAGIRRTSTAGARWAARAGATRDVLPYFKKLESSWRGAVPYHGAGGPMPIAPIATTKLLHEPLMQTAAAAGFWTSDDLHGAARGGFRARRAHGRRARPARQRRARLSQPVRHRAESRGHAGRADHARAGGARARVRRRAAARQRDAHGVRRARGDPLRRHVQLGRSC